MSRASAERLQKIPSIDALLLDPEIKAILERFDRERVKSWLSAAVEQNKKQLLHNDSDATPSRKELSRAIIDHCIAAVAAWQRPSLRRTINGTGIVLHTGLGRAPYSPAAQEQVQQAMQGYCNLEVDLLSGKRGQRNSHIADLLCQLTGAEAAVAVNNNAAAVFLALNTLAAGREAIISRGQLIEIGGSFRIPQIMEKSGVIMREVGTTNKTKLADFREAINEKTAVIVVAHTSNYRVMGFTAEVSVADLCALAHQHGIPVLHDLGGGVIVDLQQFGLPYEPLVQDSLQAGADVVTFSGDKVLGGPQCGLLVGNRTAIGQIATNPLMRVVRCDKLTFAALEATLKLFFSSDLTQVRAIARLTEPANRIEARAKIVEQRLQAACSGWLEIERVDSVSQTGSGALPLEKLPSCALAIKPKAGSAADLAGRLRCGTTPVLGYIKSDHLYLDFRTIEDEEIEILIQAFLAIAPTR
ncbi:MAG TPA: L-seryl-tRNA(Sec) selenium transferase [bacterium]|nr:L-seryl-tRNA(Sec) selenium transferase [bacterium]HNT64856.1 L-seryl-tRNA(Sec) selenium transferase [bacterium]